MLLHRLVEYAQSHVDLVPPFYSRKPVRYVLPIAASGQPQGGLVDYQDKSNPDRRRGVPRLIPSITRTVRIDPAIATDTVEYVFGWIGDGGNAVRVPKQLESFQKLNAQWAQAHPYGPGVAIAAFYDNRHHLAITKPTGWTRGDLVAFQVEGEIAADTDSARAFWATVAGDRKGSGQNGLCLVCGRSGSLLKTIPQQVPQRWLPGATQSASLVSVNEAVHGYELQKFLTHTPICDGCGLAFMVGLTSVLSDSDHSRSYSGQDSRIAWWVKGGETDTDLISMLDKPDPLQVGALLDSIHDGRQTDLADPDVFCALTVSGNIARVVVRDWIEMPLTRARKNVAAWFDDHGVVSRRTGQVTHLGLFALVRAAGRWRASRSSEEGSWMPFGAKGEDRPDGLDRALLRAALLGERLPRNLSGHIIHRITADRRVDAARVALIRLSIRRRLPDHLREAYPPMLNLTNEHPAYVCGRIFAILDDIQGAFAHVSRQKLNTTFSDRYFARAVTNPRIAIIAGIRDANGWLKRIRRERPGWANAYQGKLSEVMDLIDLDDGMPTTAGADQQELFILGFYQQRAALRRDRARPGTTADLPAIPTDDDEEEEGDTV